LARLAASNSLTACYRTLIAPTVVNMMTVTARAALDTALILNAIEEENFIGSKLALQKGCNPDVVSRQIS